MKRTRILNLLLAAAVSLALAWITGCSSSTSSGGGPNVSTVKTGVEGATSLAATSSGSRIYIGHITYGDGGALKYYDTATGTIQTIVSNIDVGDFVLDEANNRIIGTSNAYSTTKWTFYINLGTTPYTAVEIKDSSGQSFVGGDVMLYNGTVYVLSTSGYGSYNNTLYYFPADNFNSVITVNLGASGVDYGLTRVAVRGSDLYYTDTAAGKVFKSSGLLPTGSITPTLVTTAGDGSAGMIYFYNGKAFVADGYTPSEGVFTFDPASPPSSATHFSKSAAISAQFMAFTSASQAFVTHFSGGVYKFNPLDTGCSFPIVEDTDLSYVDGSNGYGLQDIVAANGHLYVAVNTWSGHESELMIVDSY